MCAKLYTKTGDKGKTSLLGGARVSKANLQIDLYGEIDELNAVIGMLVSEIEKVELFSLKRVISTLKDVQNQLFVLGSNLALDQKKKSKFKLSILKKENVQVLEDEIDLFEKECPKLVNFILPGGHISASVSHLARTVCRRCERNLVRYTVKNKKLIPKYSLEYLNRLSDYFFALSRYLNVQLKVEEVIWKSY